LSETLYALISERLCNVYTNGGTALDVGLARHPARGLRYSRIVYGLALQRDRIRRAVAALPRGQRQVLSLAFFQAYSHAEIAKALDLPLGTVKTWIRVAMRRLRESLAEEGNHGLRSEGGAH
jgi:DNA-directed RNA polymerase specialized sigma24 family protein